MSDRATMLTMKKITRARMMLIDKSATSSKMAVAEIV
jgi:hypothetical protein